MSKLQKDELSRDAFLGGRLQIRQPKAGYRAGIDPVLLAAAVPARPGQSVLELGCGAGVASLCLGRRVAGLDLTGLELQPDYARLARRNAEANDIAMTVVSGDLADMPAALKARHFDHVIANPPYFRPAGRAKARDSGRETALAGATALGDWVAAAARRLHHKGQSSFIQRADRLPELIAAMSAHLGSLKLQPFHPRRGRPANLVIVTARKGGRAAMVLAPPVILHSGTAHRAEGDDYTAAVRAVLRDGAELRGPA